MKCCKYKLYHKLIELVFLSFTGSSEIINIKGRKYLFIHNL